MRVLPLAGGAALALVVAAALWTPPEAGPAVVAGAPTPGRVVPARPGVLLRPPAAPAEERAARPPVLRPEPVAVPLPRSGLRRTDDPRPSRREPPPPVSLPPEPGPPLVALLESRSGELQGAAYVVARAVELDAPRAEPGARTAAVSWTREAYAWVGRARFEGLPAGLYELEPTGAQLQRFAPHSAVVRSGDAPARFLLLDSPDDFDLHLVVVDDATSAPIERYEVEFELRQGGRRVRVRRSVESPPGQERPTVLSLLPAGARVSWRVCCEGRAPAEGVFDPERALSHREERLVHRVEVRLERERP